MKAILTIYQGKANGRHLQSCYLGDENGGTRFAGVKVTELERYDHIKFERILTKSDLQSLVEESQRLLKKME